MGECLGLRCDRAAKLIGSAVVTVYDLMVAVTQTIATGFVLSTILGWDPEFSMVLGGLIVTVYMRLEACGQSP
jgi:SSS family solute:Na+ symporter